MIPEEQQRRGESVGGCETGGRSEVGACGVARGRGRGAAAGARARVRLASLSAPVTHAAPRCFGRVPPRLTFRCRPVRTYTPASWGPRHFST